MNEEKVINFIQEQIMDEWRMVMNYEAQLKKPEWEGDETVSYTHLTLPTNREV